MFGILKINALASSDRFLFGSPILSWSSWMRFRPATKGARSAYPP